MSEDKPRSKTLERFLILCIVGVFVWCLVGYMARSHVLQKYRGPYNDAKLVTALDPLSRIIVSNAGMRYYRDFKENYEELEHASVLTATWYAYTTTEAYDILEVSLSNSRPGAKRNGEQP